MILEIAVLTIRPGSEDAFEAGVRAAVPLFRRARGCHGMELRRSVESPGRYLLHVRWETLEDHTVHFRGSADFQEWRRLVGDFFEGPPAVEHAAVAVAGF
ncbi:antibiotic biosynthesis monooxygenase family protein [Arenibaculum pallidiluteum]|uniref:antibiotic biosynthesis monooxygenase family protein n=1 Tax=Arenibaculum pallidiluteum TaxID=2812559 RepID=UPI001A96447D|nr:antibiotic biosynthesis monooxygenase family protein [Arenibaculum pallidiluteum]